MTTTTSKLKAAALNLVLAYHPARNGTKASRDARDRAIDVAEENFLAAEKAYEGKSGCASAYTDSPYDRAAAYCQSTTL